MLKIQVLDIRGVKSNTLRAVARVQIEDFGLVINDVKLFIKGENHWVQMPSKSYEHNGEKKYYPTVQFTNKDIEKEVLSTVADAMLKHFEFGELGNKYAV